MSNVSHFTFSAPSGWIRQYAGGASIRQVHQAYLGAADSGASLVQSIVDIRSSFLLGQGLSLSVKDAEDVKNQEIYEVVSSILADNDYTSLLQQLAVLVELEGRLLAVVDDTGDDISVKIMPYDIYNYMIEVNKDDMQVIDHISYSSGSGNIVKIDSNYVYGVFGSSLWYKPNEARPRIASVMEYISSLDRCMQDLREINHLFASPTPYFRCNDQNEAESLASQLQTYKWTIGKTLITTSEYSLVTLPTNSGDALEKEMISLMERVSGSTGVPLYFIGMSRLLNNRSTALAMLEALENSVSKERRNLVAWINNLIYTIIDVYNTKFDKDYDKYSITATINPPAVLSAESGVLDRLVELYDKKAITLETLLQYVPQVEDKTAEVEKINKNSGNNQININDAVKTDNAISAQVDDVLTLLSGAVIEKAAKGVELV